MTRLGTHISLDQAPEKGPGNVGNGLAEIQALGRTSFGIVPMTPSLRSSFTASLKGAR